jgi:hypothetical protein
MRAVQRVRIGNWRGLPAVAPVILFGMLGLLCLSSGSLVLELAEVFQVVEVGLNETAGTTDEVINRHTRPQCDTYDTSRLRVSLGDLQYFSRTALGTFSIFHKDSSLVAELDIKTTPIRFNDYKTPLGISMKNHIYLIKSIVTVPTRICRDRVFWLP